MRMAFRPKRKFGTSHEREIILQQFYDNIKENEEQFLGHAFVGDEDSDSEFVRALPVRFQLMIITKKGVILWMAQKILILIILSLQSRKNCQELPTFRKTSNFP